MFSILISFAIAVILATVLHSGVRKFVRNRLRYVDSVQKGFVPFIAGGAALALAALIPFVNVGIALTVGLSVGAGVAAGVRDIRTGVSPMISDR